MLAAVALALEPRTAPRDGCALSFDGRAAIAWSQGTTMLDSGDGARAIAATIGGAAAVGQDLWVLVGDGARWSIAAWSWQGVPLHAPVALPDVGDAPEFVAMPGASASAYVYGDASCEVRREADAWKLAPLAAGDRAVPVGARAWIERRGARLLLRRPGYEQEIATGGAVPGGTIVGGGMLGGDVYAAIEVSGYGHRRLLVIDTRRGGVVRVVRVDEDSRVVLVPAVGHALIARDGALAVIDLVRNRCVAERRLGAAAFAVSGNAMRVAILEPHHELQLVSYADFTRRDVAVAASRSEPEPTAELEPEPEPAPAVESEEREGEPAAAVEAALPLLPGGSLLALCPRRSAPVLDDAELDAYLASLFELIAAMCARALARSWDSGRLGGTEGELPHADEMGAILDGRSGRASARLTAAIERERRAWEEFATWNHPGAPHMELAAEFGLSSLATAIVLVAAAPSLWGELARVYGVLCNDLARPLCDELLIAHILGAGTRMRRDLARELDDGAPLVRHGAIARGSGRRPFCELVVAPAVIARIAAERDETACRTGIVEPREAERTLDELRVPRAPLAELLAVLAVPPAGGPVRLVLRGRAGSGRRSLAAALASRAGRTLAAIELPAGSPDALAGVLRDALREAHLRGWLPCVSGLELAGDEPSLAGQLRRVLADHSGPVVLRSAVATTPPLPPGYLTLDLPSIPAAEREEAWTEALRRADLPVAEARSMASRYDVGPGVMARTTAQVARGGGSGGVEARLDQALRQYRAAQLGAIARRVDRLASWDELVLPDDVLTSVRDLCDRVRNRGRVLDTWGLGRVASTSRGVTAMFQGGPGTGKTLMAGAVARDLGFELYRVDLSKILSKWIGETEKNLATVFDAAEDGELVLLFDEADALFARRTEVKSSNDRHANNEVNYLLQRLDAFEGIAILTTNFGTSIDDAFRRRLSLRLTVPFPEPELRLRLWQLHLPDPELLDGDLELGGLARRYAMSGAYIRNAALRAAYLAAARGSRISAALLDEAARAEYRDADRLAHSGELS